MAAPKEAKHGVSSKTLFVRNLPYTVTDQQLENVFTDIGPVKRCFIVRKKGEESSRGFGYVTFALLEDANKALKKRLFLEGRKLLVHVADKRQVDEKAPGKKKKKKEESEFEFEDESEEETEDQSQKQDREDRKRSHQEKKYLRSITLVLTGFRKGSTLSDISTLVQDIKTLSKIIYPVDEEGEAHLRFKSIRDTRRAERKLNNKQVGDITLKAVQLSECHKLPRDIKRCRLIIRNLSFKCKPPDLKKIFSKFGEVLETNIPTKPNGLMRGFGFVQFSDLVSADDAVNSMNGKNIFGRPVAVDWALSIDHYKQALSRQKKLQEMGVSQGEDGEEDDDEGKGESDDVVMSGDEEEEEEEEDSDDDEEDDSDEDEEEDVDSHDDGKDEDESDDEGFADSKTSDEDEDETSNTDTKEIKKSDVEEGKTIFMRNVSFDTSEERLQEALSVYGDVRYVKLVKDPVSGYSKGVAFAQFRAAEMAKNCICEAEQESEEKGVIVDGRKLLITLAVDRKTAEEYREKEPKKEKKDKRNLYLIREGYIRPGSEAAKTMDKADINKRLRNETAKRHRLKNPSIFVSTTRLCVHNLPPAMNDQKLRQFFLKVVNDKSCKITECRIMRDLNKLDSDGVGKSRGYAFIEFTQHEHALKALRATNNNPDLLSGNRRLIVEFSLENKQALITKQKRLERQRAKQETLKKNKEEETASASKDTKKNPKTSTKQANRFQQKLDNMEEQSKVAKKLYSGPKGAPKHLGAKIRHKQRPGQQNTSSGKVKKSGEMTPGKRKMDPSSSVDTKRKRRKPNRKEEKDDFDKLINKYKQKLMTSQAQGSRSKWFD